MTDALSEIEKIKVGMKRKDLNEIFVYDGGISPGNESRLVYKKCQSIKVVVKFELDKKNKEFQGYNPEDKIVEISKPYLENRYWG